MTTRKKLWLEVYSRYCNQSDKSVPHETDESLLLQKLASGLDWMEMIPPEYVDIYGAIFDEAKDFDIPIQDKRNVEKDVRRTFGVFTKGKGATSSVFGRSLLSFTQFDHFYESLKTVLVTAAHETSYCQGMNFVAAAFLVKGKSARECLILLCFLLKQRHLEILYNSKCSSLMEYMKVFEKRLRKENRKVYNHFKTTGFGTVCYAIEWFTTCFIVTCPGDLSFCVLDMLLMGFKDILLRVGLAILGSLENEILSYDLEDLQHDLKKHVQRLNPIYVIDKALAHTLHGPPLNGIPSLSLKLSPPLMPTVTRQDILQVMAKNIELMNPAGEMIDTMRTPHHESVSVARSVPTHANTRDSKKVMGEKDENVNVHINGNSNSNSNSSKNVERAEKKERKALLLKLQVQREQRRAKRIARANHIVKKDASDVFPALNGTSFSGSDEDGPDKMASSYKDRQSPTRFITNPPPITTDLASPLFDVSMDLIDSIATAGYWMGKLLSPETHKQLIATQNTESSPLPYNSNNSNNSRSRSNSSSNGSSNSNSSNSKIGSIPFPSLLIPTNDPSTHPPNSNAPETISAIPSLSSPSSQASKTLVTVSAVLSSLSSSSSSPLSSDPLCAKMVKNIKTPPPSPPSPSSPSTNPAIHINTTSSPLPCTTKKTRMSYLSPFSSDACSELDVHAKHFSDDSLEASPISLSSSSSSSSPQYRKNRRHADAVALLQVTPRYPSSVYYGKRASQRKSKGKGTRWLDNVRNRNRKRSENINKGDYTATSSTMSSSTVAPTTLGAPNLIMESTAETANKNSAKKLEEFSYTSWRQKVPSSYINEATSLVENKSHPKTYSL